MVGKHPTLLTKPKRIVAKRYTTLTREFNENLSASQYVINKCLENNRQIARSLAQTVHAREVLEVENSVLSRRLFDSELKLRKCHCSENLRPANVPLESLANMFSESVPVLKDFVQRFTLIDSFLQSQIKPTSNQQGTYVVPVNESTLPIKPVQKANKETQFTAMQDVDVNAIRPVLAPQHPAKRRFGKISMNLTNALPPLMESPLRELAQAEHSQEVKQDRQQNDVPNHEASNKFVTVRKRRGSSTQSGARNNGRSFSVLSSVIECTTANAVNSGQENQLLFRSACKGLAAETASGTKDLDEDGSFGMTLRPRRAKVPMELKEPSLRNKMRRT